MTMQTAGGGGPAPSGLADVIDAILDKGLVIDAYVRVALIGIEILTIDARIVIASVDTYLRFAEAVNRLDIAQANQEPGLPELMDKVTSGGASSKTKGVIEGVKEKITGGDDEEDEEDKDKDKENDKGKSQGRGRRSSSSSRSGSRSRSSSKGSS